MSLKDIQNRVGEERAHLESIAADLRELAGSEGGGAGGNSEAAVAALPLHQHYRIYREYVEHEDGLTNKRLLWNINIQGFLFATYGLSVQKVAELLSHPEPAAAMTAAQKLLDLSGLMALNLTIVVLPIIGILISVVSWIGVWASRNAITNLKGEWDRIYDAAKPKGAPMLPALTGGGAPRSHWAGLWPPLLFPWLFVLTWAAFLFTRQVGPWLLSTFGLT